MVFYILGFFRHAIFFNYYYYFDMGSFLKPEDLQVQKPLVAIRSSLLSCTWDLVWPKLRSNSCWTWIKWKYYYKDIGDWIVGKWNGTHFSHKLTAVSTWGTESVRHVGSDRNGLKLSVSFWYGLNHCRSLCTDGHRIRGILHIASCYITA